MSSFNQASDYNLQEFINLQKQINNCKHCQSAFGFQPHPILFGNMNAKIMQISQAPSRTVPLRPETSAAGIVERFSGVVYSA